MLGESVGEHWHALVGSGVGLRALVSQHARVEADEWPTSLRNSFAFHTSFVHLLYVSVPEYYTLC